MRAVYLVSVGCFDTLVSSTDCQWSRLTHFWRWYKLLYVRPVWVECSADSTVSILTEEALWCTSISYLNSDWDTQFFFVCVEIWCLHVLKVKHNIHSVCCVPISAHAHFPVPALYADSFWVLSIILIQWYCIKVSNSDIVTIAHDNWYSEDTHDHFMHRKETWWKHRDQLM